MLECCFRRDIASLEAMWEFLAGFFAAHDVAASRAFDIELVLEELFTNMVKYGRGAGHDIEVGLALEGTLLTIVLRDRDVEPWDVTQAAEVDTARPLLERKAGGLGLHFVRQIADRLDYEYTDRTSIITVTKRLEA
jgi:anti-sigma regulatory factor (Ser/Thr protein kinase)